MSIFSKKKTVPVPKECEGMEIVIQSSTCTGEKTIGFFNPDTRRLMYSELVRTDADVAAFYEKYGIVRR